MKFQPEEIGWGKIAKRREKEEAANRKNKTQHTKPGTAQERSR